MKLFWEEKIVAVKLIITFDKKDCFHLMGLQYLTDRPELRRDRGKLLMNSERYYKKGKYRVFGFYHKIQDRVHFLPLPEKMLDSNDTVFKYNKKSNVYSMIEADYLMKNHMDGKNLFLFYLMQEMIVIFVVLFFPEEKIGLYKESSFMDSFI